MSNVLVQGKCSLKRSRPQKKSMHSPEVVEEDDTIPEDEVHIPEDEAHRLEDEDEDSHKRTKRARTTHNREDMHALEDMVRDMDPHHRRVAIVGNIIRRRGAPRITNDVTSVTSKDISNLCVARKLFTLFRLTLMTIMCLMMLMMMFLMI